MTWLVTWNDKEYDVDPSEMSGFELKLVKDRTGLSFKQLVNGIGQIDGEAIMAVFWIAARREAPDLKFSDFQGPPIRLVVANLEGFNDAMEELGKLAPAPEETETSSSESSPSTSDTTEPSTTD